jgi:hypothetical protein
MSDRMGWDKMQYAGGMLDRQVLPPQLLAQAQARAMGQGPSAASIYGNMALGQAGQQAAMTQQAGGGFSPLQGLLAARYGLQQQASPMAQHFGGQARQEQGQAGQAYTGAALGAQSLNDAYAMAREQAYAAMRRTHLTGQTQESLRQAQRNQQLMGGLMSAAGAGLSVYGMSGGGGGAAPAPGGAPLGSGGYQLTPPPMTLGGL